MKLRLTDKRRFNYIVLTLLAIIILIGIIQIMIEIKVLSI
jgi:hypothetical protein